MKTDGISNIQNAYNTFQNVNKPGKGQNSNKTEDSTFKSPVDTYVPSFDKVANPEMASKLWNETDHMGDAVRKLIASALGVEDANGQGFWAKRVQNLNLSEADRAYAKELISEDGYFGVKQTTDRIMSFAKALVGEGAGEADIEKMRAAVQKGFDEVAKMFGGFDKLPDVTKDTYKAIMEAFDTWKAGSADAATAADTE